MTRVLWGISQAFSFWGTAIVINLIVSFRQHQHFHHDRSSLLLMANDSSLICHAVSSHSATKQLYHWWQQTRHHQKQIISDNISSCDTSNKCPMKLLDSFQSVFIQRASSHTSKATDMTLPNMVAMVKLKSIYLTKYIMITWGYLLQSQHWLS